MEDNPPIEEVKPVEPMESVPPAALEVNLLPTALPEPTVRHSYENYTKKGLYNRGVHAKDQLFSQERTLSDSQKT